VRPRTLSHRRWVCNLRGAVRGTLSLQVLAYSYARATTGS
jgi:hypothetical protein